MITPTFDEFQALALKGNMVPIYQEIMADLDTPVAAFLKAANDQPYAFLLESATGGERWGRYSIIGLNPRVRFQVRGNRVELHYANSPTVVVETNQPLQYLKRIMATYQPVTLEELPPFHGGAVGYIGYDLVRCFESIPDDNPDTLGMPDAFFLITDTLIIFDNLLGRIKIMANAFLDGQEELHTVYQRSVTVIQQLIGQLRLSPPPLPIDPEAPPVQESDFQSEMSQTQFEDAVRKAKEYILAGDIMQVVLSQRLTIPFHHPPFQLYRALRAINPSPYLFFLKMDGIHLVGASPEILVRLDGQTAIVRPIAGTRRRGRSEEEDKAMEQELLADPKELAEHIMLVDLGRNDLGRVCEIGSVRLTDRMIIERYSHVMHIVSHVEGQLKPEYDIFDLIAATFPAGTVSGAPKIRAMEIIDELEISRRGPYAGTVGYISYSGHMDLAITIRTAFIQDHKLSVQAGAGIVADSVPEMEYKETLNKARVVFHAVDMVQRGLV